MLNTEGKVTVWKVSIYTRISKRGGQAQTQSVVKHIVNIREVDAAVLKEDTLVKLNL